MTVVVVWGQVKKLARVRAAGERERAARQLARLGEWYERRIRKHAASDDPAKARVMVILSSLLY